MRHRVDHRKLGRKNAHRKAMLCNMVTSLFDKERIHTTDAKAKEARRFADRLITKAKKGRAAHLRFESLKGAGNEPDAKRMQATALAHWRNAGRFVKKPAVLRKLFDVIAPQFMERPGGYTRIIKLGLRPGDNARTVLLELVKSAEAEAAAPAPEAKEKAAEGEQPARSKKAAKAEKTAKAESGPSRGKRTAKEWKGAAKASGRAQRRKGAEASRPAPAKRSDAE